MPDTSDNTSAAATARSFHVVALRGFAQRGKREVLISDIVLALKQTHRRPHRRPRQRDRARRGVVEAGGTEGAMSD